MQVFLLVFSAEIAKKVDLIFFLSIGFKNLYFVKIEWFCNLFVRLNRVSKVLDSNIIAQYS